MENLTVETNTLYSFLPQNVPFIMGQVSEAVALCKEAENAERNLKIACEIAEQVALYSNGAMFYNYTPIILALLKDVAEETDLSKFDTIDHAIPVGLAQVKQILNTYGDKAKNIAKDIVELKSNNNVCMVVFANMLADIKEGKNALPIAYITMNLNFSRVPFVNETYKFFCNIMAEVGKADY